MRITIHTDHWLTYVDMEDPIPAGLEPLDDSLPTSQQGITPPPPSIGRTLDLNWYVTHSDLRDNRVSLYMEYLPAGTYAYTYFAQATVTGQFGAAPTHAQETLFPEVFGRGAGQSFTVG